MNDSKWQRYALVGGPIFVVLAIVGTALAGSPPAPDDSTEEINSFFADNHGAIKTGAWLGVLAALFLVWWFATLWRHMADAEGGRPRLAIISLGGLMVAVTYLLYPVLARLAPFIATDTVRLYSAFRPPSLVIASVALTPVILGEELVWRGVVQTVLVRRFRAWGGVTLAAVAYALAHAPLGSPVLVIVALLCGLFWGALRATTSSLVPTLVAHLVWDFLVLLWLPLDSR